MTSASVHFVPKEPAFSWTSSSMALIDHGLSLSILLVMALAGFVGFEVVGLIAAVAVLLNVVLLGAIKIGWTRHLQDPLLMEMQVIAGCAINLIGLFLAPQLAFLFVVNLFVPLAFGCFYFGRRAFVTTWLALCAVLWAAVMFFGPALEFRLTTVAEKMAVWSVVCLALGRFLVAHSQVSKLRSKLRTRNLELSRSREFVTRILANLPVAVAVFDPAGRLTLSNRVAEASGLFPEGGAWTLESLLDRLKGANAQPLSPSKISDTEVLAPDGRHYLINTARWKESAAAASTSTLLTMWDVTDVATARAQRERALNFLSHDLRSPLAATLALVNDSRTDLTAERDRLAGMLHRSLSLADDFVLISKSLRLRPIDFRLIDLAEVAMEATDNVSPLARRAEIRLKVDAPPRTMMIRGSWSLLLRAITNLLDNAIRLAPPGSSVEVVLKVLPGTCAVTVSDSGPGLPAELISALNHAYDNPSAAEAPMPPTSGLGLALVAQAALAHQAVLSACNRPSGGAALTLRFATAS